MNHHQWKRLEKEWSEVAYLKTIDKDAVTMDNLQSMMTWDAPLHNLPPEIMEMIISLHRRIERLEDDKKGCA